MMGCGTQGRLQNRRKTLGEKKKMQVKYGIQMTAVYKYWLINCDKRTQDANDGESGCEEHSVPSSNDTTNQSCSPVKGLFPKYICSVELTITCSNKHCADIFVRFMRIF